MAEVARSLDRARFRPHVACFQPGGFRARELESAGIPILALPVRSFRSPSVLHQAARLGAYLREQRIRLVHTFDVPGTVFGVPAARFYRAPVVISSQRANRRLAPALLRPLLRVTDRLVDAIVVNCRAIERHLIEDQGVPAGRLRLCYNGLDTSVFFPSPAAPPSGLESSSLVIGTACALRPEKGLPDLLAAVAQVQDLVPGLRLVILGSGPMLDELVSLSRRLNLEKICLFEPATADVARWLRAMDIFVLPSHSEALSNVLMEAMACGCCPVATRVGGNPELVNPGVTGLLAEPGDPGSLAAALATLIRDPALRQGLASSASRFVTETFALARMTARMAEIYEEQLQRLPAASS